jgi:protein-S-isoprenylcysteine O-methyltransferase Ste14
MQKEGATTTTKGQSGRLAGVGGFLLRILGFFVILEPIWMLLPFAGFLYGSGLRIQVLARHSQTAWLTHFVFPVLTLGMTGPILVVLGFLIFLVGAGQIYTAKLLKRGMVRGGLYAFIRHPQYTALTFFGVGLLLAWGRAIMFLAFFVMMFLYYFLAKSEERKCVQLFGAEYEAYRRRTSFCLPGDKYIARLLARLPSSSLPRWLTVVLAFMLTLLLAFGLKALITAVRTRVRTVPFMAATVQFSGPDAAGSSAPRMREGRTAGVPYVASERMLVVRGPWRNAAAPGFAETVLQRSLRSEALAGFLEFLDTPSREVAVIFCAPYTPAESDEAVGKRFLPKDSHRRGPEPDPDGPDRARLIVMRCELADGAAITDVLADKSRRRIVRAAVAWIDLAGTEGGDIVSKGPNSMGRPGAPMPEGLGEERWDHVMSQLAERESLVPRPREVAASPVPAPEMHTELVLVQAPILRTRIQPEGRFHHAKSPGGDSDAVRDNRFAMDIRDRLADSPAFRERLKRFGAGGDTIPVAFPRPGPNWYREHRVKYVADEEGQWQRKGATPQVSVFVMLVRRKPGIDPATLFDESRRGDRAILGAFIADLDFAVAPPGDSVREIAIVGPRRDLEERWTFFLSGL